MSLTLRRVLVVAGVFVLALGFMGNQFLASQKEPPPRKPPEALIRKVDTFSVHNTQIPTSLAIQGSIRAYDKIEIFTEVSGTLVSSARPFKEGSYFSQGATLIKVDDTEARLSLQAQKSALLNAITQMMPDLKIDYQESFPNWSAYLSEFNLDEAINPFPKPVNDQEKFFVASRNLYNQYYTIKSGEERLSKYLIKAPFSGVITAASINPGTLVRAGQKLGELMNTKNYELEATVPLRDLEYLKVGDKVTLRSDDIVGKWTGKIRRINNQLDPGTQSVTVFVAVNGSNLKEGMYLRGNAAGKSISDAVRIPKRLLINQKSVYGIQDNKLVLHDVEVIKIDEHDAVLKGIADGTVLVENIFPGMFDGMTVAISE